MRTEITVNEKIFLAEWVITNNSVNIREVLREFRGAHKRPRLNVILGAVSNYYGIQVQDMTSSSRKGDIVNARHVFMYLGRLYGYDTVKTGLCVSRDHATVIHAHKKIEMRIKNPYAKWYDKELAEQVADITTQLRFRNLKK